MWRCLLWLGVVLVWAAPGAARELAPGDILLLDSGLDALLRIDPESGDRQIVTSNQVGRGPKLRHLTDLELADDGGIVLVDRNAYQILRVDPGSGDRVPLIEREQVRRMGSLRAIARRPEGGFWLSRAGRRSALYRLDPHTREHRELRPRLPPRKQLRNPVAFVPDGARLLVADSQRGVLAIDPESGDTRVLTRAGAGKAPLREPFDMVRGPGGALWVADKGAAALLRIDPLSGEAVVVSGGGVGAGEAFRWPSGLAFEASGMLLLADRLGQAVFRVDPVGGERRVLSSPEVGEGPGPRTPRQLLVVPGQPARSSWPALVGAALLVLLGAAAWLRRRR